MIDGYMGFSHSIPATINVNKMNMYEVEHDYPNYIGDVEDMDKDFMIPKNSMRDVGELLDRVSKEIDYKYPNDPTRPGIIFSYIPSKQMFYAGISRYKKAFGKEKYTAFKAYGDSPEEVLTRVADFVVKEKRPDPIQDLEKMLKA